MAQFSEITLNVVSHRSLQPCDHWPTQQNDRNRCFVLTAFCYRISHEGLNPPFINFPQTSVHAWKTAWVLARLKDGANIFKMKMRTVSSSFSMAMLRHTSLAAHWKKLQNKMSWEVLPHPSYSNGLAPPDYHMFGFVQGHKRGEPSQDKTLDRDTPISNTAEFKQNEHTSIYRMKWELK